MPGVTFIDGPSRFVIILPGLLHMEWHPYFGPSFWMFGDVDFTPGRYNPLWLLAKIVFHKEMKRVKHS